MKKKATKKAAKKAKKKKEPLGPLSALAEERQFEELRVLVDSKKRLDPTEEDVATAFVLSGFSGDRNLIAAFLNKGVPPGTRCRAGNILHVAAAYPDAKFFQYVAKLGFDYNEGNWQGETPLILAVRYAGRCEHDEEVHLEYAEIVRLLIKEGADVNVGDKGRLTALDHACKADDPEIAEMLLSAGAEIGECSNRGYEALSSAIRHLETPILELLLQHGAGLDSGRSPKEVAQLASFASSQGWVDSLRLLIDAGWPATGEDGTNLMEQAERKKANRAKMLRDLGL